MTKIKSKQVLKVKSQTCNKPQSADDAALQRILKILEARGSLPLSYPKNIETRKKLPTLAAVEANLLSGKYNSIWKFIEDCNRVFNKVQECWEKRSKYHKSAVHEIFGNQMDVLMEDRGFCCGRFHMLYASPIKCNGKHLCKVEPGMIFYRYNDYTYCQGCFDKKSEPVQIDGSCVSKSQFKEFQCNLTCKEPFVRCRLCYRKVHAICVLHDEFCEGPYCCDQCCKNHGIEKNSIRASKLPSTECDQFIEKFLQTHKLNETHDITIRLLSESSFVLHVKPNVQEYRSVASELNVRTWVLFTFFDSGDGVDICVFAAYVQLYGSDCEGPNKNSAYISYIDSVNFLPSSRRTKIYRYTLLGLFEYLKTKGFKRVYLWSCPPKKHHDYIFHRKPSNMKIPTRDRLSKWYSHFLALGIEENIIISFDGIKQYAAKEEWNGLNDVPYLEGDLWPNRMEGFITTLKKQFDQINALLSSSKAQYNKLKSNNAKRAVELKKRIEKHTKALDQLNIEAKLWAKMKVEFNGFNTDYFVIWLDKNINITEVEDNQPETVERPWINSRHEFLDFFCDQMLEFSTERRAKFSSRIMLFKIFAESQICVDCGEKSAEGLTFNAFFPEASLHCQSCFENKVSSRLTICLEENLKPERVPVVRVQKVSESVKTQGSFSPDSAYNSATSPQTSEHSSSFEFNASENFLRSTNSSVSVNSGDIIDLTNDTFGDDNFNFTQSSSLSLSFVSVENCYSSNKSTSFDSEEIVMLEQETSSQSSKKKNNSEREKEKYEVKKTYREYSYPEFVLYESFKLVDRHDGGRKWSTSHIIDID